MGWGPGDRPTSKWGEPTRCNRTESFQKTLDASGFLQNLEGRRATPKAAAEQGAARGVGCGLDRRAHVPVASLSRSSLTGTLLAAGDKGSKAVHTGGVCGRRTTTSDPPSAGPGAKAGGAFPRG